MLSQDARGGGGGGLRQAGQEGGVGPGRPRPSWAALPWPSPLPARGLLCAGHGRHADFIPAAVPPAVLDATVLELHAGGWGLQRAGGERWRQALRPDFAVEHRPGRDSEQGQRSAFRVKVRLGAEDTLSWAVSTHSLSSAFRGDQKQSG